MLKLQGRYFIDESGRTVILRGVNLGGSSKVPFQPNGASWNKEGFYDHKNVSFVGRPFPLEEADEHFARLKAWGFTFLRFLVTWEAIEHAGPGIYDQEYLDYIYNVVKKAADHGIDVFIDPHQDVWSRFTGGDGAPGWTLELAGFNLQNLHASGAAIVHQEHGDPFPRMVWPTNYNKLAAATMFTLFFGGRDFAPHCLVDGISIQDYLQDHYIQAVKQVALKLDGLANVVGYDTLNEPSNGYIGEKDLNKRPTSFAIFRGESPTIFQGMLMGAGYPQKVDVFNLDPVGLVKTGRSTANSRGIKAWQTGREDIWRQHGVWGLDAAGKPAILKPDYFSQFNHRPVNFYEDYFKPFANRFAQEIRSITPETLIFVEGIPSQTALSWNTTDAPNVVHAAHFYDDLTLLSKHFQNWIGIDSIQRKLVWGKRGTQQCLINQIASVIRQSDEQMNHAPTLIGETGIPFDMQGKKAFRTKDYSMQIRALDATMIALEQNFANFTLWNYTSDNTNARGDMWNDEDLSLFSRDQQDDPTSIHSGGRALKAALRPYPRKIAGEPLSIAFDIQKASFEFTYRHTQGITAPTEIYIPEYQYPTGCQVEVSDGVFTLDLATQNLVYNHSLGQEIHTIRVCPQKQA